MYKFRERRKDREEEFTMDIKLYMVIKTRLMSMADSIREVH